MIRMKKFLLLIFLVLVTEGISGQRLAIKVNAPCATLLIPNASVEAALGDHLTLDVSGAYNPFQLSETKKWRLWTVQPEMRYWLCRNFSGAFVGLHGGVGQFNMAGIGGSMDLGKLGNLDFSNLNEHRYQGSFWDIGFSYGHHWILSPRWGVEANIGFGYGRYHYERFRCLTCGEQTGSGTGNYFGPTRASLSLVYMIR
jgi:hypothetical protein